MFNQPAVFECFCSSSLGDSPNSSTGFSYMMTCEITISVGASGALFVLLGAMVSNVFTNWTIYAKKVAFSFCSLLPSNSDSPRLKAKVLSDFQ